MAHTKEFCISLGLNEVVYDKSIKLTNLGLVYLNDISVIIKLKTRGNYYEEDIEDYSDQYVINHSVKWASYNNKINILNWWKGLGFKITNIRSIISEVSWRGHVYVLEWWKQYCSEADIEFRYEHDAIDYASFYGRINILNWWVQSGLQLKYSNKAIDGASLCGHINVLDWWIQSGLELKYSYDVINDASIYGCVDALNWWLKSGLDVDYTDYAIISAAQGGNSRILMWWRDYGSQLRKIGNTNTDIHIWLKYFLIPKLPTITIDCTSRYYNMTYEWDYANAFQMYLDTAHYSDDEYDYDYGTDNILDYDCNYKTRKTKRKYSKKQCYNRKKRNEPFYIFD